jgi:hypothetical protein
MTDEFKVEDDKGLGVSFDSQLLSSLMACARKTDYTFNLNLRLREGKSNSLEVGSLAHCILEFYYKAIIDGKDKQTARDIGFAAAHEYRVPYEPTNLYIKEEDHPGLQNTPEDSEKYVKGVSRARIGWKYVFETMSQYFDHHKNESWTPIAAEQTRGRLIYEDSDLKILYKAKFDLIVDWTSGFMSVDHKTMSQNRDSLSLNNQFMGQALLLGARNVCIDKIGWQTSLKPEEKFQRVLISYTADRLSEWANEIVPFYARLLIAYNEAGYYPPNFTQCESKYGFCQFKDLCERDRGMREEVMSVDFIRGKEWDISND